MLCSDSPPEGDGFEPSVPQQIRSRFRDSSPVSHDGLTVSRPGSETLNPAPYTSEAGANLTRSGCPPVVRVAVGAIATDARTIRIGEIRGEEWCGSRSRFSAAPHRGFFVSALFAGEARSSRLAPSGA